MSYLRLTDDGRIVECSEDYPRCRENFWSFTVDYSDRARPSPNTQATAGDKVLVGKCLSCGRDDTFLDEQLTDCCFYCAVLAHANMNRYEPIGRDRV